MKRIILIISILAFLTIHLYSGDSVKYTDCTCNCIKKLSYNILPDTFYLGYLKNPDPWSNNSYEKFGLPKKAIVKFNIYNSSDILEVNTDYCMLSEGNYEIIWADIMKPAEDFKTSVYYLEIMVKSTDNETLLFKNKKRIVFIK